MAMLDAYEAKLFDNPTEPLDSLFKTMRQAAYKRKHGRRARGEEEDDGSQEEDPENPDTPTRAGARPSSTLESQRPLANAMDCDGVLDL
ncbi:hypothetical protein H632_c3359p0 [Helicosporidium sp. ATCC 50920]|nr:hypothetical protein H632_c3359p0 [Helicosporidium sp. ATCC 50920]|eukprot:KDD72429.1 hypothetical protein H632_c3359p0 [Helicosporidium sp. ATCC 50920]